MCINAILVASLALANGFTGVFSLGHVGFVAIGAYASGILSLSEKSKASYLPNLPDWLAAITLPFLPVTIAAGLICVLRRVLRRRAAHAALGPLRLGGDAGLPDHRQHRADQRVDYTRGARTFTGVPLETTLPWAVGWLVVTLVILARIVYSPTGRRYRAVREDTIAAQAIGISVLPTRLSAFMLGAFFAGVGRLALRPLPRLVLAGELLHGLYVLADLSMLVIGGMQSLTGAVLGVVLVVAASEVLRNLERGIDLGAFASRRSMARRRSCSASYSF